VEDFKLSQKSTNFGLKTEFEYGQQAIPAKETHLLRASAMPSFTSPGATRLQKTGFKISK